MDHLSKKIVGIDVFCGVGGLTHGLINSGIKIVAGIDNDSTCKYSYEKNNNAKFILADIERVKAGELASLYGKDCIRLLAGCAPCQPFSKHSYKVSDREKNEKWGLLYKFGDLIGEMCPDIVTMENVPQIAKEKVFLDFLQLLSDRKYNVYYKVVYCPDYGIPQRRMRLVLLASRFSEISLIPSTHSKDNYITVREVIGNLESLQAGGKNTHDALHTCSKMGTLNLSRIRQSRPGGNWLDWESDLRADCHGKSSGSTYRSVYGRMTWDEVSPTITTQFYNFGTGRFGHPEQDRALSLREGALLQTFPLGYEFVEPGKEIIIKHIARHIGNAVPVLLGKAIGQSIIEHVS